MRKEKKGNHWMKMGNRLGKNGESAKEKGSLLGGRFPVKKKVKYKREKEVSSEEKMTTGEGKV